MTPVAAHRPPALRWTPPEVVPAAAGLARSLARSRPVFHRDDMEAALVPPPPPPEGPCLPLRLGDGEARLTLPPALARHLLVLLDPAAPDAGGELAGLLLELAVEPLLALLLSGLPGLALRLAEPGEAGGPPLAAAGLLCRAGGAALGTCLLEMDGPAAQALSAALSALPARRTRLPRLPVALRARLFAADLLLPELRGMGQGDVVVALRQLPGRGVLLVAGERLAWQAVIVQGGARAEVGPFPLAARHGDWTMTPSDSQDVPPGAQQRRDAPQLAGQPAATLDELPVRVVFELGRLDLPLQELEAAGPGHVFELGRDPSQAVDIVANGLRVGAGEVVSIGGQLGVRVLWIGGGRGGNG